MLLLAACVHSPGAVACITPTQAGADPAVNFCLCMYRMYMRTCNAASSPGQTCPEQAPEHPRLHRNDNLYPPLAPQVRGTQCGKQNVFQSCAHQHKAATLSHRRHILQPEQQQQIGCCSLAVSIMHCHAGSLLCNCCCQAVSYGQRDCRAGVLDWCSLMLMLT